MTKINYYTNILNTLLLFLIYYIIEELVGRVDNQN